MRSASGRAASAASCSSAVASTRSGCRFSLPSVTRLASSRSSIRRAMWASWRSTMARAPANGVAVGRRHLHDRDRVADRRQRIAQLVRQHRHELVLAPRRLAQLIGVALALGDVDRVVIRRRRPSASVPAGPVKKCQVRDRAARHPQLALAAVDPLLDAEQRADRRHHDRLPLAVRRDGSTRRPSARRHRL